MSFIQTNTYFTLTNYVPSLQTHELSQPSPLKRISSRDSDERLLKEEKQITQQIRQETNTPEKVDVDGKSRWSMTR
jgi:hypothetical protein